MSVYFSSTYSEAVVMKNIHHQLNPVADALHPHLILSVTLML